jgi:hypothetical protein
MSFFAVALCLLLAYDIFNDKKGRRAAGFFWQKKRGKGKAPAIVPGKNIFRRICEQEERLRWTRGGSIRGSP